MRTLLELGAYVDAIGGEYKRTPLHLVVGNASNNFVGNVSDRNYMGVTRALIDYEARTDIKDETNRTALEIAKYREKKDRSPKILKDIIEILEITIIFTKQLQ